MNVDLSNITPPRTLSPVQKCNVFQFIFRRLASYRNTLVLYAVNECSFSQGEDEAAIGMQEAVEEEVNVWAQELLKKAWVVCFDGETESTFIVQFDLLLGPNYLKSNLPKAWSTCRYIDCWPVHKYSKLRLLKVHQCDSLS